MKKSERQARLEQIIDRHVVSTQEELLQLLRDEGIDATQATISRDIREMQIVKARDSNGVLRYTIFHADDRSQEERLHDTIQHVVAKITQVQFLNVIRTLPSNGNLLAAILDDIYLPEVVGTVAGYDTIVVISPDVAAATHVNKMVNQYIQTNHVSQDD
ncbi:arginine repressor [Lactobacillus selangorensis]|uniref:Arginine repressor n=1 Tax=Lactobacillus selangorensis TaxID=81857 RepID=A0A0R2FMF1_9LACO|nr:ArgR family transcriptional regulator [Lactobacillus selangorensis]KRN29761.1 arginine repressor [Lactobacillus selangorensis]KRN33710.1 arginine repressor [Lactobacillus selangorensis]